MKETGFYIIKDKFFEDFNDKYLKGNKYEARPHYYCFEDSKNGIYWMIPMSSRVDKYKRIMDKKLNSGKSCDILHIAKLDNDKTSVFLIQDMFPITYEYIEREYTISQNHLMLTSEHMVRQIERKAKRILALIKKGVKFIPTQPDVVMIYNILLEKQDKNN